MRRFGGIDLGGTKIQAVVDRRGQQPARLGAPADARPRAGRRTSRRRWRRRCATRRRPRSSSRQSSTGSAWALRARSRTATSRARATCPAGKARSRSPKRCSARSDAAVAVGNDVQVATDAEFKLGAGRLYSSLLGVFWGTGVGGGLILDGKPWLGTRRGGRDRPRRGRAERRALHLRPRAAAWRPTRGARRWKARARAAPRKGPQDGSVQADEGARPHAPDQRRLGARARARRQARRADARRAQSGRSVRESRRW